tara:strand:+ start:13074 stop:13289 length:216 start_codon:yes stop_codon:yes gene_type:complete
MIVQKMKCPQGCEESTFLESVKAVMENNSNLLLDSKKQPKQTAKSIKVYTCNCCHNSFEIPEINNSSRMVL